MEKGMTEAEALALTEEFFPFLQPGQRPVHRHAAGRQRPEHDAGRLRPERHPAVNPLTALCLKASLNNRRIDPKINLRVDKNTPVELYELGTQLTRQGLGFPQYANDDVVIPALVDMGYDLEDARDYVVAACWEFIIPGVAMDIPNIEALCWRASFPT
jgi:formate C-acetyltransferase